MSETETVRMFRVDHRTILETVTRAYSEAFLIGNRATPIDTATVKTRFDEVRASAQQRLEAETTLA